MKLSSWGGVGLRGSAGIGRVRGVAEVHSGQKYTLSGFSIWKREYSVWEGYMEEDMRQVIWSRQETLEL